MAFTLRPYQLEAVDATIKHFRQHPEPALIALPTGAGKSLVIAELAKRARGRVLVLAHVKELVAQNHSKYCAYGLEADIFAAGLQQKESSGKVVFGSVQSVARNLSLFDGAFSLLIVDECHRISDDDDSQYQQIIQHLQKTNPQLRLLGLTATPYRLGKGWIYQYHYHGITRGDGNSLFRDCIYELPLRYMIKHGFLVPPERLDMPIVQYDFSRLEARSNGLFSEVDLNRELKQQNRITPHIISQIVEYAETRKGVMIFASTVEHAREVHGLLPSGEAALVSAETPPGERDALIEAFKQQQLRYLVNVAVLTTGFDAPHVDSDRYFAPYRVRQPVSADCRARFTAGPGQDRLPDPGLRRQSPRFVHAGSRRQQTPLRQPTGAGLLPWLLFCQPVLGQMHRERRHHRALRPPLSGLAGR